MKTGRIAISLDLICGQFQIPWKVTDAMIIGGNILQMTVEGKDIPGKQVGAHPVSLVGTIHTEEGRLSAVVWKAADES